MSYLSAFEYQSKSSVSISDLNKLRKYIKFNKDADYIKSIRPVFEGVIEIFNEKSLKDIDILISFNSRNSEDNIKSSIYQLYRTIQKVFKDKEEQLSKFIKLLEQVINGYDINNDEKIFLMKNIAEIIMEIDSDIIEYKLNEEKDNSFIIKGF